MRNGRTRLAWFAVVCLMVVASTAGYLWWRGSAREEASTVAATPSVSPASGTSHTAATESGPRIVFRHTETGADVGRVAVVSLSDPGGARAITDVTCDRVGATATETLCLVATRGMVPTYAQRAITTEGAELSSTTRPGIPSRARLSADGALAAATAFVSGDSYNAVGFSTRTFITTVATGDEVHLEDFRLVHQGQQIDPIDRNYWGVTFVDDDRFYATVSFDGRPWLAAGRIDDRTVETVREGVECPSLSPDGTHIAYKKRNGSGGWGLAVLDLADGSEIGLPEDRSVDDQVIWLDDSTLAYGLPRADTPGDFDVWSVAADGTGSASMLIPHASSPSLIP